MCGHNGISTANIGVVLNDTKAVAKSAARQIEIIIVLSISIAELLIARLIK